MNRTVRWGVATTLVVVCLSLLDVSVFAQKKRKPRRKRARVTRVVLPGVLVSPQTNVLANSIRPGVSANNLQSGLRPADGSVRGVTKPALAGSQVKPPTTFRAPTLSGPAPSLVQAGEVIISELRLRGPAGAEDEFVELYNNTDSEITSRPTTPQPGGRSPFQTGRSLGRSSPSRTAPSSRRAATCSAATRTATVCATILGATAAP
jgi:hypothetical protein